MLCYDCPRKCGVDREKDLGFCREGDKIRVASVIENFKWEEPCISGEKGALAIFFSGCNLRCEFCQNYDISHKGKGKLYTPKEFREYLESFDLNKYSSIDLITPSHFPSLLREAFGGFKSSIPIVWNSGGYENVETIDKISSFVDVFLPDFKYFSRELSKKLSCAEDYFEVAVKAIKKMQEIRPKEVFGADGVLEKGLLIRHLVLPGHAEDSIRVLDSIKENVEKPFISVMGQFTPTRGEINRKLYPLEYKAVLAHAERIGLERGYFQELESAGECFIPKFY